MHGIPYYAIGGTCIGAVRHKGFIPWDDDLDIAIPIDHFDRFTDIAKKELPEHLYVYSSEDIRHYHYIWLKICDKRTTFIEESEKGYSDAYKGVFVDVMPLSGVPCCSKNEFIHFLKKIKRYQILNDLTRFPVKVNSFKDLIKAILSRTLTFFLPFNFFSKKYLRFLKRFPLESSLKTGYVWDNWNDIPSLIFSSCWFGDGVELDFEDTHIRCPKDFDRYLKAQFGEYMVLPPVEQRQIHNGFVDINKSYIKYRF